MAKRGWWLHLVLLAAPAAAHDFQLTDVLAVFKTDGTWQVDVTCDLDALALGAGPGADSAELAAHLRSLTPEERGERLDHLREYFERRVRVLFDGEPVTPSVSFPDHGTPIAEEAPVPTVFGLTARLEGRVPEDAATFSFRASRAFPPVHLTVLHQGHAARRDLPEQGTASAPYALDQPPTADGRREVVGRYLVLGFWHIVPEGLDHVLFVLGLFLLSARLRSLLWQVSAFTAAHTVTLALATYGVVTLPSRIVEPLIALSIAYVAVENVFTEELKPWRVWVVFAFGLLHGLGFAGVLGELGLPRGELAAALLAFNAGVELGQLAVILLALLALGAFRHRAGYRRRVVVPASLAIAAVGLYWAVERILG
jgi:hypothetical protein